MAGDSVGPGVEPGRQVFDEFQYLWMPTDCLLEASKVSVVRVRVTSIKTEIPDDIMYALKIHDRKCLEDGNTIQIASASRRQRRRGVDPGLGGDYRGYTSVEDAVEYVVVVLEDSIQCAMTI